MKNIVLSNVYVKLGFVLIIYIVISILFPSIKPTACYDKESVFYDMPILCFERNITMNVGRDNFASTFKIPESYFNDFVNQQWFGYREIRLDYLYPEMKPLKPFYRRFKDELSPEEYKAMPMKTLSLEIHGRPGLIKKDDMLVKYYLTGKILEDNVEFTRYGRALYSYYDYNFWIKNKKYPYVILCVARGLCSVYSSFNEKISYEFSIDEQRLKEWEQIDQLVRIEISKFLQP